MEDGSVYLFLSIVVLAIAVTKCFSIAYSSDIETEFIKTIESPTENVLVIDLKKDAKLIIQQPEEKDTSE